MSSVSIDLESDEKVAAWLLYLNRAAFNRLYRVDRQGRFNVPIGRRDCLAVVDTENLRSCAMALRGASIMHVGFATVLERARAGDLVHLDPPFGQVAAAAEAPGSTVRDLFAKEREQLRAAAHAVRRKGVYVLWPDGGGVRTRVN